MYNMDMLNNKILNKKASFETNDVNFCVIAFKDRTKTIDYKLNIFCYLKENKYCK
jgi:hypothetical protein